MKTACLAIPPVDDLYPWKAVRAGLEQLGLQVVMGGDGILDADMLVVWSPWNGSRRQALQFNYTRAGKPVIVMENGWLSPIRNIPFYQVALDGWNGTGRFHTYGHSRWQRWNIRALPWIHRTGPILVCGQRGHPSDERTAPPDWHANVQIGGIDPHLIIRRPRGATRALVDDLAIASEVHVWSSNAASWSVVAGIPVVQHGPNLMVGAMASSPGHPLYRGDRLPELERLAWAQWDQTEIMAGHPFANLLVAA